MQFSGADAMFGYWCNSRVLMQYLGLDALFGCKHPNMAMFRCCCLLWVYLLINNSVDVISNNVESNFYESVIKYKCSIIQTEQNTTQTYKWNEIQIQQNTNVTKYKCNKIQHDKIQIEQNAKFQNTNMAMWKYKCYKIQMQQNTNKKMKKYKHSKIQKDKIQM